MCRLILMKHLTLNFAKSLTPHFHHYHSHSAPLVLLLCPPQVCVGHGSVNVDTPLHVHWFLSLALSFLCCLKPALFAAVPLRPPVVNLLAVHLCFYPFHFYLHLGHLWAAHVWPM